MSETRWKKKNNRLIALAAVVAVALAPAAVAEEDADQATTRQVEVHKVMFRSGDGHAAPQGVFVKKIATDDGAPTVQLRLLGSGAEMVDVSDLEVGESRSVEGVDGTWTEIRRTESGLVIDRDGDVLEVPLPGAEGTATGVGLASTNVFVLGREALEDGSLSWVSEEDGAEQSARFMVKCLREGVGEDAAEWAEAGGPGGGHGERVVVVRRGDDGAEVSAHARVVVCRKGDEAGQEPLSAAFVGLTPGVGVLGAEADFSHLESLKDLDPEVREKVVAALREILSGRHGVVVGTAAVAVPAEGARRAPREE